MKDSVSITFGIDGNGNVYTQFTVPATEDLTQLQLIATRLERILSSIYDEGNIETIMEDLHKFAYKNKIGYLYEVVQAMLDDRIPKDSLVPGDGVPIIDPIMIFAKGK